MEGARNGPILCPPLPYLTYSCLITSRTRAVTGTPGRHQAPFQPLLGDQCALDLLSEGPRF